MSDDNTTDMLMDRLAAKRHEQGQYAEKVREHGNGLRLLADMLEEHITGMRRISSIIHNEEWWQLSTLAEESLMHNMGGSSDLLNRVRLLSQDLAEDLKSWREASECAERTRQAIDQKHPGAL